MTFCSSKLKSLRSPTSAFDILDYVSFYKSNTRSSSSHKLNRRLSLFFYTFLLTFILRDYPVFETVCLFLTKTFLRRQLYLLSKTTFGLISLSIIILLIHALFTYHHVHVLTVSLLSLTVLILLDPNNFSGCLTVESVFQSHILIYHILLCVLLRYDRCEGVNFGEFLVYQNKQILW